MIEVRDKRRGAWGLYVFEPTPVLPAFAQWVNDAAPGWAADLVRVVADARASGVMRRGGDESVQRRAIRDAYRACGNVARACDCSSATFAPYAIPYRKADNGPDPWVNLWADPMPAGAPRPATATAREATRQADDPREATWGTYGGTWRRDAVQLLRAASPEAGAAANLLVDLHYRFGLTLGGELVENAYTDEAPDPTRRGSRASRDNRGVTCADGGGSSAWACLVWSVSTPPFGAADSDVVASCVVPLAWQWALMERVADNVSSLGSVAALVEASREYVAALNLATALASGVPVPERVVQQAAQDQQRRFRPTREEEALSQAGEGLVETGNPVGLFIGGALLGGEALANEIGRALQYAVDPWGLREPAVRNPFLSGEVSGDLYVPPTHEVAPPPPGGGFVDGRTFLNNAREVFTEDGVYGGGGGTPARPSPTSAPSSGGGAEPVAVGVGLYLLAKLAGFL